MVGKGGVTEQVLMEAKNQLDARELVKGRVLETAFASAREVSDAICEETGADGVSCVGNTFVIWRKSKKLEAAKKAAEKAAAPKKKVNPVKAGRQKRRAAAKAEKERKAQYYHDEAVKAAIERRKQYYQD